MYFEKRAENQTIVPVPKVINSSGTFDGNDGKWSTFIINIGYDSKGPAGQDFKVLISTSSPITLVPVASDWCNSDCAANRGVQVFQSKQGLGFQSNLSSSYKAYSTSALPLSLDPAWTSDDHGNGSYGFDNVGLGPSTPQSDILTKQWVVGTTVKDMFMGSFGLAALPLDAGSERFASFLKNFNDSDSIPSLSYGYTAGASYRNNNKGVLANLVFGGYDQSRFSDQGISIAMPSAANNSLLVGVQSIEYVINSNQDSFTSSSSGFLATIDSSLPYLWLPQQVCDQFADKFQLEWDSDKELYTVNDTAHTNNQQTNASVVFRIGKDSTGGKDIASIVLPYAAFDLEATYPIYDEAKRYFPIKPAPHGQYVLGRTFLQEAYIVIDYERLNFTVAPAIFPDPMPDPRIIPIFSKSFAASLPSNSSTTSGGGLTPGGGLSPGAIAGIAVGAVIAFLLALLGAFLFWKKRREQRKHLEERATTSEIDTQDAGGEAKHRGVSELDSNPPGSPKPSTLGGYYGDRDQKDVIPFAPIKEMESPPEIVELESPPLPSAALSSTSPQSGRSEITEYFDDRLRRRGATRESSSNSTPGTPGIGIRYELPGDDGKFQVSGQHFEPVQSPVHSRGPSDATTPSGIDEVISGPPPENQAAGGHTRDPSATTVQSDSTAVSQPTQEQLEAWALARATSPHRPLSE